MTAPSPAIPRRHDLDALRAVAMLLGIALHAALSFMPMPDAGWPVHDVFQRDAFSVFVSAVHGFRMPLFFLISGFFTAMLWRKRGLKALLVQRFQRIFVPLAIGMVTIVPSVWIVSIGAGMLSGRVARQDEAADIWRSAGEGQADRVAASLDAGTDVDGWDPAFGATPLAIAAWHGRVEVIELLLARGADVNARNRDGSTALHGAAFFGRSEAARVLLENGADAGLRNQRGETAGDALRADWGVTRFLAGLVRVSVEREQVAEGRRNIHAQLPGGDAGGLAAGGESSERGGEAASGSADPARVLGGLVLGLMLFPFFHHLWFLWFLCWFVAAFAVYASVLDSWTARTRRAATAASSGSTASVQERNVVGSPREPPGERSRTTGSRWRSRLVLSPLRYAWLIPLTVLPQSMMGLLYPNFGPDTSVGLLPMPWVLFYYAIFFFFGVWYFDADDREGRVGRWWPLTLSLALLVVFPLGHQLTVGGFGFGAEWLEEGMRRPLGVVLEAAYAWLMTFAAMGLFRTLLSRESQAMRYLSDASYWMYLAHLPLIIVLQAIVRNWQLPALAKFLLVCAVTSGLLLACYQWLVRYTWIGRLLNGPRTRSEPVLEPASEPVFEAVLVEPSRASMPGGGEAASE